MQTLSLIFGILAIILMLVGFIPFLGALNWINIPLSGLGLIFSLIALFVAKEGRKGGAIAGVVCCGIAIVFGLIRLVFGGGVV